MSSDGEKRNQDEIWERFERALAERSAEDATAEPNAMLVKPEPGAPESDMSAASPLSRAEPREPADQPAPAMAPKPAPPPARPAAAELPPVAHRPVAQMAPQQGMGGAARAAFTLIVFCAGIALGWAMRERGVDEAAIRSFLGQLGL